MKFFSFAFIFAAVLMLFGCRSVYSANRADTDTEGTVVFTRPVKFHPFFGSYSLSDFVEITYDKCHRNEAGQLVVEVGIRYRGPVQFSNWTSKAPATIAMKVRSNFFSGPDANSPIVYETNDREIVISRGQTYAYRAACPDTKAQGYRVILGDY